MPRIRWAGLGIGGGGLGIVALALIARLFGINPLSTSDQPENEADRKITQEI